MSGLVLDLGATQGWDWAVGSIWDCKGEMVTNWLKWSVPVPATLQSQVERPAGQGLLIAIFPVGKPREAPLQTIHQALCVLHLCICQTIPSSYPVVPAST